MDTIEQNRNLHLVYLNESHLSSCRPIRRKKILIVDTDLGSSIKSSTFLKFWGYDPEICHSYKAALETLRGSNENFSMVLVELRKLDSDTLTFPCLVRSIEHYRRLPIIINLSLGDKKTITDVIAAGYSNYLVKPMEPDLFKEKVSRVLGNSTDLKELIGPKPAIDMRKPKIRKKILRLVQS